MSPVVSQNKHTAFRNCIGICDPFLCICRKCNFSCLGCSVYEKRSCVIHCDHISFASQDTPYVSFAVGFIHDNIFFFKILFQPSEETGQGARAMIDAGLVDDVEAIIGTHNNPNYAPGQLAIGVEPMMAGCVKFRVTLHAQGTHAGYPYKGTGPIEALASIILSLQTIVSRNVTPFHPLVLSVTEVHGGHVWNVVPAEAGFQGTVRYFHKSDGNLVGRRFKEVVEHTAEAYGISADVVWDDFQDPLVSDPGLAKAVAADVNDYAQLEPIRQSMAGEDFCEFAKVTLPVFAFVGSNGQEGCADWHSPHFVGLDESIPTFVNFYVNTALRVLNELK